MLWSRTKTINNPLQRFTLPGERIFLRPAMDTDRDEWLALRAKNKAYLTPFEPTWPDDALTPDFYDRRLIRVQQDWVNDHAYAFLVFSKDTGTMIGGMNINNVTRGAAQYATLGYWIDEDAQGQGLMKEAGMMALSFVFKTVRLARMNAACMPHNLRSKKLLLSLGFTEEGFAKGYIQINGKREDHVLFGLNADSFSGASRKA
jgi:[ribosomal protein S5]-alanine N-acetyltransferase